jgi:hypothetical protein
MEEDLQASDTVTVGVGRVVVVTVVEKTVVVAIVAVARVTCDVTVVWRVMVAGRVAIHEQALDIKLGSILVAGSLSSRSLLAYSDSMRDFSTSAGLRFARAVVSVEEVEMANVVVGVDGAAVMETKAVGTGDV